VTHPEDAGADDRRKRDLSDYLVRCSNIVLIVLLCAYVVNKDGGGPYG
jgi:hypothetical protein